MKGVGGAKEVRRVIDVEEVERERDELVRGRPIANEDGGWDVVGSFEASSSRGTSPSVQQRWRMTDFVAHYKAINTIPSNMSTRAHSHLCSLRREPSRGGFFRPGGNQKNKDTHWSMLFGAAPTFSNLVLRTGSLPPSSDSLNWDTISRRSGGSLAQNLRTAGVTR